MSPKIQMFPVFSITSLYSTQNLVSKGKKVLVGCKLRLFKAEPLTRSYHFFTFVLSGFVTYEFDLSCVTKYILSIL